MVGQPLENFLVIGHVGIVVLWSMRPSVRDIQVHAIVAGLWYYKLVLFR